MKSIKGLLCLSLALQFFPIYAQEDIYEELSASKQPTIIEQKTMDEGECTITDTAITLDEAFISAQLESTSFSTKSQSAQLTRPRRMAKFYTGLPGSDQGWEYASMFMLNNQPAFCIEPLVMVIIDGNDSGPVYHPTTQFQNLSFDDQVLLGRILWYGYGHPLTGTSDAAWLATQLLIWEITDPHNQSLWNNQLEMCHDKMCTVSSPVDVSNEKEAILNRIHNRDTAPSFANQNRTNKTYELDWNETLVLNDSGSSNLFDGTPVLDWFKENPIESHQGINIQRKGNQLFIDIDDLYYEGYNQPNGKTLTFERKNELFHNALANNLIWVSDTSQRILSASWYDPSVGYQLSFKLKTANLEIEKLDEYYLSNNLTPGTTFWIGWQEDPTHQYRHNGGKDQNWTQYYTYTQDIQPDEYGEFDFIDQNITYYPILNKEKAAPQEFVVDEDGKLHVEQFLPQNKSWWIKEVHVTHPYQLNSTPWLIKTGKQNTLNHQKYVNLLKDVSLTIIKKDTESKASLNKAEYILYEIAKANQPLDLSKEETLIGNLEGFDPESFPPLTSEVVFSCLPDPQINDTFYWNQHEYTIQSETDTSWILSCKRYDPSVVTSPITIDQIPDSIQTGQSFIVDDTEYEVLQQSLNQILFKKTDTSVTLSIDKNTSPSTQELPSILEMGMDLFIGDKHYTLKSFDMNDTNEITSAALHPADVYSLQKKKTVLNYSQLPKSIKERSSTQFEREGIQYKVLQYTPLQMTLLETAEETISSAPGTHPVSLEMIEYWINDTTEDGGKLTPSKERIDLSTLQIGQKLKINDTEYTIKKIHLKEETQSLFITQIDLTRFISQTLVLDIPPSIQYSDFPKTVNAQESFTIETIINPVYLVKTDESTPKFYQISDSETWMTDENMKPIQRITDYSVLSYLDLIQADSLLQGAACQSPYNPAGCPVNTSRKQKVTQTEQRPYTKAQYEDLSTSLDENQTLDSLKIGEPCGEFTVITPVNAVQDRKQITLSFVDEEGQTQTVTLKEGSPINEYTATIPKTITYTIIQVIPKEFIIAHTNSEYKGNSETINHSYHLIKNGETQYHNLLNYDAIPNVSTLQENDTFEIEGVHFTVTYHNPEEKNMVVKDDKNKTYALTPEQVTYRCPITYTQLETYETNNKALKPKDSLPFEINRSIKKGDQFEINGIIYTLLSKQDDAFLEVAFNETNNQKILHSDYSNVFEKNTQEGSFIDSNGTTIHCWKMILRNPETKIDEEKDPELTELFRIEKNKESTTLDNLYTTERLWMIEQGNTVDLSVILPTPKETEVDFFIESKSSYFKDGSLFQAKQIDYLNVSVTDKNNFFPLDSFLSWLNLKQPELSLEEGTRFIYQDDLEYTIEKILFNAENSTVKEILLTRSNLIDPSIIESVTVTNNPPVETPVIYGTYPLIITSQNSNHKTVQVIDALPMAKGITGSNTLRITDYMNHHIPIPNTLVSIYDSPDGLGLIKEAPSDSYGMLDISELNPGVYFHSVKNNPFLKQFTVYDSQTLQGELRFNDLKWGRTYLACEVKLPEGYQYHDDVCFEVTLDYQENTDTTSIIQENELRKIDLHLIKTDENNESLRLNGALFRFQDLSESFQQDEDELQSTASNKLLWSDLPNQFEVGDQFTKTVHQGNFTTYQIQAIQYYDLNWLPVEENGFIQSNSIQSVTVFDILDDSRTPIILRPPYYPTPELSTAKSLGTHCTGGIYFKYTQNRQVENLLWSDVVKQLSDDITQGSKVTVTVPVQVQAPSFDEIHNIKHLKESDTFWFNQVQYQVISPCTEQNGRQTVTLSYGNQHLICITEGNSPSVITIDQPVEYTITEVIRENQALQWENLPALESLKVNQIITIQDINYRVAEVKEDQVTLQDASSTDENGKPVFEENPDPLFLHKIHKNELLLKPILAIKAASKNEEVWLYPGQIPTTALQAIQGANALIYDQNNQLIQTAVTNENGEIIITEDIFGNPLEGQYTMVLEEEIQSFHIQPGTIELIDIPYGHQIEICEIKAPNGYQTNPGCEIITVIAEENSEIIEKNIKNRVSEDPEDPVKKMG